jgi:RsiW-degrading membrane proteinase PrsW (M82 family)
MDEPWLPAVLAAFVPALLWLLFFYSRDRYEREPTRAILIFFVMGAVLAVPMAILLSFVTVPLVLGLGLSEATLWGSFAVMFLLAGLPEETIKGGLSAFRAKRERDVDEPVDTMVYFTSLGLGFGALETVLYIVGTYYEFLPQSSTAAIEAAFFMTAPIRALTVTMGHGLWTGIVGYFWGGRHMGYARSRTLVGGILLAAVLHATYNTLVSLDLVLGIGVLVVTATIYTVLFRWALARSPFRPVLNAAPPPPTAAAPAAEPPAPANIPGEGPPTA